MCPIVAASAQKADTIDETSSRTMNVFFIFVDTRRARYWTKLVI